MFLLKATQQVELSVTVTDKRGNPAQVQNGQWESSDESVVTVVDSGTNSAVVKAVGPVGASTVTYVADVDLGDGVTEATGMLDIEVVAGDASVFNITAGTPSEQTDAPTP